MYIHIFLVIFSFQGSVMKVFGQAPVVDLSAAVVHNKIKLFWVAPAESVDHYGLRYRSIMRDNSTEWGVVSPWVQTSWTLHSPFPGERYEFEVYSVKGGIQSSAQNTTYLYRPSPPQTVNEVAENATDNSVLLRWSHDPGYTYVEKYFLRYTLSNGLIAEQDVPLPEGSACEITVTGLEDGYRYQFTVQSVVEDVLSATTSFNAATCAVDTYNGQAPLPVTSLRRKSVDSYGITIEWTLPEDCIDSHKVKYRPVLRDSNSAWNTIYRGIENTAVLNGLFPGEDYEIKVFSLKSDSESTLVNITQMTVPLKPSLSNVMESSTTESVEMKWTHTSSTTLLEHWVLKYSLRDGTPMERVIPYPGDGVNDVVVEVDGLEPGYSYRFYVTSVMMSATSQATILLTTVPNTGSVIITPSAYSLTLTVERPAGGQALYMLECKTISDDTIVHTSQKSAIAGIQTFLVNNVSPYTDYSCVVTFKVTGNFDKLTMTTTTLQAAPTIVRNFVVVQTNKSETTLTWEIPEYPNGIIVHYSVAYTGHNTKGDITIDGRNVTNSTETLVFDDLVEGNIYVFSIFAETIEPGPVTVKVLTLKSFPYYVEYLTDMSPPSNIPAAKDRIYSVAVNSVTSRPLKAVVKDFLNNLLTSGDFLDVLKFDIESKDENALVDPNYDDSWLNSGGHLAFWGAKEPFPGRMQRQYFKCITENSNNLSNFTIDRGMLVVDGLIHKHPSGDVPPNKRVYRLKLTLSDGKIIFMDTNKFQITAEAKSLQLVGSLPSVIEAGTPFSLTFNVMDKDGVHLTDGTDSVVFGELQVAWENDTVLFYEKIDEEELVLFKEMVRMRGSNTVQKKATHNYVIRSQFVGGTATFSDVQILDVHPGVRLNLTVFLARFPWTRRPDDFSDSNNMVVYPWVSTGYNVLYMDTSKPSPPAVYITSPIQVTAQTATQLVITTKADIKAKHNANFPLEAEVVVEIRDTNGKRVYSGLDSTLEITVTTTPPGTCLSADANFTAVDGQGIFLGSICEAIAAVTLQFDAVSAVSGSPLTPDVTGSVEINNEIHLASYTALQSSFQRFGQYIGGHVDAFSHFAVNDINNGMFNLSTGRQFVLHTYDTSDSIPVTVQQYNSMKVQGKADPSRKIRGVIGFGDNTISAAMQPFLTNEELPQLATREDSNDFGNKEVYPYFNRISWDMGAMSHSVMMAAKSRLWHKGVVLRCLDVSVSNIFYMKAKQFGIDLTEITIPVLDTGQFNETDMFTYEINKMKSVGTKIIWLFCRAPLLWKLIHELWLAQASPLHGYQWATVGDITWMMPYENQISFCQGTPLCSEMAKGSQGFASTYFISSMGTPLWEHVQESHIKKDAMHYSSGPSGKLPFTVAMAELVLGYDAVLMFATAMDSLIQKDLTITGPALAEALRNVQISGLTGEIKLNEKGNRRGYVGAIVVTDPWDPTLGAHISSSAIISRYFEMESEASTDQMEYTSEVQWPLNTNIVPNYTAPVNPYTIANTPWLLKRKYNTSDGMFDNYQQISPIPPATGPVNLKLEMVEDTVASYYCTQGCGGGMVENNMYRFGNCVSQDLCVCHKGFTGKSCSIFSCDCGHGYCEEPDVCTCDPGWVGSKCDKCSPPCEHGRCISPGVCDCDSGFYGDTCDSRLMVLVVITFLLCLTVGVGSVVALWWLSTRLFLRTALKKLDWYCDWEDVTVEAGMYTINSAKLEEAVFSKENYVLWDGKPCFAQRFDCDTLDVEDEEIRMEIIDLKTLKHTNVLPFIGACLQWPNVCILTEPCPKGSLEDVIFKDSVRFGWDFRFSVLKDICCGMEYLHRSAIESHGRLKSSNCLIDKGWRCKISGFGAPTLRYDGARRAIPNKRIGQKNPSSNLLLTAPELLRKCHTLDDVGKGTQAGDAYSFAIMMTEVISRDRPYSQELISLTADEVLQLVKDKDAPSAVVAKRYPQHMIWSRSNITAYEVMQLVKDKDDPSAVIAKRIWYVGGGDTTKYFRPRIDEKSLAGDSAAKIGMIKLCERNWDQAPERRLSFKESLASLNEIYPIKGKQADNMISMLDKYCSNLQDVVVGTERELEVEKARVEQLTSQMLPEEILNNFQHGIPVGTEDYDSVTIFFSDVVGFTQLTNESTPYQVIELLSDLYALFDTILDQYNVYKIETISDAFMVVSGLPERIEQFHAGEIASMSLHLVSSICDFKIRHMPDSMLQLRIGMHSGRCVAGVVGRKVPKYCLFGDTVSLAASMLATSIGLKIQMSEATAKILSNLGGYQIHRRRERKFKNIKGRPKMNTYWLDGKEGFTLPLPVRHIPTDP